MVRADLEVRGKLRAMAKETGHVRVRWKVIARAKAKAKERMRVKVKVKEHARAMGRVRAKKMVRENVVVAAIDEIIRWTAWLSQSQRLRVGRELYWTVV